MSRYWIEPRDRIYVQGYGCLSYSKNISKILSSKYSQKLLNQAKKSATHALKTDSTRAIADKITKFSRISPQNSSGTVRNEKENFGHDEEILTEGYISLEEKAANY